MSIRHFNNSSHDHICFMQIYLMLDLISQVSVVLKCFKCISVTAHSDINKYSTSADMQT